MATNLELKARCRSWDGAIRAARNLGARDAGLLRQVDTYFDVPSGRLKLRVIQGVGAELIFYDRASTAEPSGRWSSYVVYPVRDVQQILRSLSSAWPVRVVVRKRRRLFILESARIHLDEVAGLGRFIEFEVLLTEGKGQADALYERLRKAFAIQKADVRGGSYADLLRPLRRKR